MSSKQNVNPTHKATSNRCYIKQNLETCVFLISTYDHVKVMALLHKTRVSGEGEGNQGSNFYCGLN